MTACTIVNPTAARSAAVPAAGAAALGSLTGRTVALVRNAWPSWHAMTDRLEKLLR